MYMFGDFLVICGILGQGARDDSLHLIYLFCLRQFHLPLRANICPQEYDLPEVPPSCGESSVSI